MLTKLQISPKGEYSRSNLRNGVDEPMFIRLIPRRYPLKTKLFPNAHSIQVDLTEHICVLDSEACEQVFCLDDYSVEIVSQFSAPEIG